MRRFSTIVADPPWPQRGRGAAVGRNGFRDSHGPSKPMPYQTMSIQSIRDLEVGRVAKEDAHLYLWTTSRFLDDAFDVMKSWGFRYSTSLVWAKTPIGGGMGGPFGIATEYVLFGRRGSLATNERIGCNWFSWKRKYVNGRVIHSAKPDEFFEMVERVSPGPYLEMFARRARSRWSVWGNEAPDSVKSTALA